LAIRSLANEKQEQVQKGLTVPRASSLVPPYEQDLTLAIQPQRNPSPILRLVSFYSSQHMRGNLRGRDIMSMHMMHGKRRLHG